MIEKTHYIYKFIEFKKNELNQIVKEIIDYDEECKIDEITYAYLIYNSYSWNNYGYIPFFDLFNHNNDFNVILNIDNIKTLINNKDIEDGEQIYDNYGKEISNKKGELVCKSTFPSKPLFFWAFI